MQQVRKLAVVVGLALLPAVAQGGWSSVSAGSGAVYKCVESGHVTYQAGPCPAGATQTLPGRAKRTQAERAAIEALVQKAEALSQQAARARPNRKAVALPELDVERRCERVASAGGTYSATTYNGCIRMERDAYDSIKSSYGSAAKSARQRCQEVATVSDGGSYSTLKACIEMETDAARNKESISSTQSSVGNSSISGGAGSQADVPKLDVKAGCRAGAEFGGGYNARYFNHCIERQQASYRELKSIYGNYSENIKEGCLRGAKFGSGGNYRYLLRCLKRQKDALKNTPDFQY